MGQASYVFLLIAITVVMAAALAAFAMAFDTYVIRSGDAFAKVSLEDAASDLAEGRALESLVTGIQRLI